jgi:hypothetical protein
VQEGDEKTKLLQNPGGEEVMARFGGKGAGLPFLVFLDAKGGAIVNSLRPVPGKTQGANVGHPWEPEEVDWFMTMLKKAAPTLAVAEARTIDDWLRGQKQRAAEEARLAREALAKELADLYKADQADRENWARLSPDEQSAVGARDEKRRQRVMEMVRASQLLTADDFYHAAMVLQHGAKPEDFLLAHELASVAAFKGRADAKWLSAAALDRFLQSVGRPQRFGTQFGTKDGSPWTQDPYDRSLPDAIRKEYGVPTLREQKLKLEEMNKQKKQ